ncbi:MAG: hypothetical protein ACKVOU_09495 [Cytophagales bacterium]
MGLNIYHTCEDRGNIDKIEQEAPYKCTHSKSWLGEGYYFWDSNVNWAHEWGQEIYTKNGYVICEAQYVLNECCLDLFGNVNHLTQFRQLSKQLFEKLENPNEMILCSQVIAYMKKFDFKYDSIRSYHTPKNAFSLKFRNNGYESIVLDSKVQICLLNKNCLVSHSLKVVYPG